MIRSQKEASENAAAIRTVKKMMMVVVFTPQHRNYFLLTNNILFLAGKCMMNLFDLLLRCLGEVKLMVEGGYCGCSDGSGNGSGSGR